MNARENYLAFLNHESTDFIPNMFSDAVICGGQLETFENGPLEGGMDGFNCNWIPTASAGGQPALDPFSTPIDDIDNWREQLVIPNLDDYDWESAAATQLKDVDRSEKVIEYHSWNSIFLRFTHLLGFENALCAMYEDPEATGDLLDAICDYKIAALERIKKYFNPDSYVNYDDVATEKMTFMSPEIYRDLIKPRHKRLNDAAIALGMIPQQHCCGYCTDLIEDFIDEGSAVWQAAQPSNDLAAIIEKYGDKISVTGGYDTQGRPGAFDATPEEIIAEVDRCFNEYGKFGKAYCFFGFLIGDMADPQLAEKMGIMIGHAMGYRAQGR